MIDSIKEAVSISLNAEFGDDYTIYTESVGQGLLEPCFFVFCINISNKPFPGQRYLRKNSFCIQYIPAERDRENEECGSVAEKLFLCLEWINIDGGLVRGTDMRYEITDGVLSFFVNYDGFIRKAADSAAMEDISEKVSLKG